MNREQWWTFAIIFIIFGLFTTFLYVESYGDLNHLFGRIFIMLGVVFGIAGGFENRR